MYTKEEIQMLRDADPGVQIPGVDTPAGNPLPASALKSLSSITTNTAASIYYDPSGNRVVVKQAGAVLSGYNFGSATVTVEASNVTISDSSFSATSGYYAVWVYGGNTNTTVTNCSFNSNDVPAKLQAWVVAGGQVTITNNSFIDTPADGLDISGGGVVSGNYFSGGGYTSVGSHPDAIWVTDNGGQPLSITNNFIDFSTNSNSNYGTNDCIRITSELGSVGNVTVNGNYLLNGNASVDAGNEGTGTFSNISITNNYMGFANNYAFYPGPMTGVTQSGNVVFDWTNPAYVANAWAAYQAAGLPKGATTTYGGPNPYAGLKGGGGENNFVAGYGREYLIGGSGANVFTYLVPNGDGQHALPSVIENFDPAKDVIDLSHIDADLTQAGVQSFTFIGTNAFTGAGAQVRYQQSGGETIVEATLAGDTSPDLVIDMYGLYNLTAANFALTAQQSAADLAGGAALAITSVRSGDAFEYTYSNVKGQAYTSYAGIEYNNGIAADDLYMSASSNVLNLSESKETITRGGSAESFAIATASSTMIGGSLSLAYHSNETINLGAGAGAETFVLSQGFGNETINGFAASGTNADTLQLSTSAFSYLNAGMTQAQDLAAVLSQVASGPNATIVDSKGDSLTLAGVTAATLASNPSAVKFV